MNHELNAEVAEKILGWKGNPKDGWNELTPKEWGSIGIRFHSSAPDFSGSIEAAWTVVEKMRSEGFGVSVSSYISNKWTVEITDQYGYHVAMEVGPVAETICRAALSAKSVQSQSGKP